MVATTESMDEPTFTYSSLAKVDADWLRNVATNLRLRLRKSVRETLEAGVMLRKARHRLSRGQWKPWLKDEAQVPVRSASRLIGVARVFGEVDQQVLERFTPTALYALAENGVPRNLREYALEQVQDWIKDGKDGVLTAESVSELLEAYRDNPTAPTSLARKDEPIEVNPDDVHAADNWKMLAKLIGQHGTVHISAAMDTDPQLEDVWFHGVYLNTRDGVRREATCNNLERVLLSLSGETRQKECPKCGDTKSLEMFSVRRDRPDGRNRYCLSCERRRVKEYERTKREKAKLSTPSPVQAAIVPSVGSVVPRSTR